MLSILSCISPILATIYMINILTWRQNNRLSYEQLLITGVFILLFHVGRGQEGS
jgi:hypothetical protein